MFAKYGGTCKGCGKRFAAGVEVVYDRTTKSITGCPSCSGASAGASGANGAPAAAEDSGPVRLPPKQTPIRLPVSNDAAREAFDARFKGLDEDQAKVAAWNPGDGNLQVVAAAGSGKTATVVALVARLIWEEKLKASEMVVTTFTSKAGRELLERLAPVCKLGSIDPAGKGEPSCARVGTFHGLALRSLRQSVGGWDMSRCMDVARGRSGSVLGTPIAWARVLGYAGETGLPGTGKPGLDLDDADVRAYMLAVDVERAKGLTGDALLARLAEVEKDEGLPDLADAWKLMCEVKFHTGGWDFADALQGYLDGLKDGSVRDGAKLVIVDEAQDNNPVQIAIAAALAKNGKGEIIFVGDLRQAIYSWRGAEPELFATADRALSAGRRELPNNYRSVEPVVALGNAVSNGKTWSLGKPARAHREDKGQVTVQGYEDPAAEAEATAAEIVLRIAEGAKPADFAVLCRTNALTGSYEAALVQAKVPCAVVGGIPFFARKEVRDVIAYLTLTVRDDPAALARIVNRPKRYLGKKFAAAVQARMAQGLDLLTAISNTASTLYSRQKDAAHELRALLITFRATEWPKAAESVANLLSPVDSGKGGDADEDRSGIPTAVAAIAKDFDSCEEFLTFAARCAGEIAEAEEGEQIEGRVTISTLHKAKGLEWKTVFMSATENVFPHARASGEKRRSEEERLFYVGVTRARDTLHLTYSHLDMRGRDAGPSEFLDYVEGFDPDAIHGRRNIGRAPILDQLDALREAERAAAAVEAEEGDEDFAALARLVDSKGVEAAEKALLGPVAKLSGAEQHALVERALAGDDDEPVRPAAKPDDVQPEPVNASRAPLAIPSAEDAAEALFGTAWPVAQQSAEALTAKEPKATEGEGGRYVEVTEKAFSDLLGSVLGFHRADASVEAKMHQQVWEKTFSQGAGATYLRVYTTIPVGTTASREVGEDSIKVAAVFEPKDPMEDTRPLNKKLPYACRTRGWRVTLLSRIAEVTPLVAGPTCPKCGAPMKTRMNMKAGAGKSFLGCCRYPKCNGSREIAATPAEVL